MSKPVKLLRCILVRVYSAYELEIDSGDTSNRITESALPCELAVAERAPSRAL